MTIINKVPSVNANSLKPDIAKFVAIDLPTGPADGRSDYLSRIRVGECSQGDRRGIISTEDFLTGNPRTEACLPGLSSVFSSISQLYKNSLLIGEYFQDTVTGIPTGAPTSSNLLGYDTDYYLASIPSTANASMIEQASLGSVPPVLQITGSNGISFNVTWDDSVAHASQSFVDAVKEELTMIANSLSSQYPCILNFKIGWGTIDNSGLPDNALGASSSSLWQYGTGNYKEFRGLLSGVSSSSVIDKSMLAGSLPTKDPTKGRGKFVFTGAQGKALGVLPNSSSIDCYLGFANTEYLQTTGSGYDLNSVIFHEATEGMGRIMNQGENQYYTVMDLMHYSNSRKRTNSLGGYLSADGRKKIGYLNSLSGGDAGDWASGQAGKPNLGSEPCNAFSETGYQTLSPNSFFTMDALGWNLGSGSLLTNQSNPSYVA